MNRYLRGAVWLGIGALAALVLCGAVMLVSPGGRASQQLPDSSLLTLEAVTYGAQHRFIDGSRWQQALYPVLPDSIRKRLPVDRVATESPGTLVLWTRRRAAVRGQALAEPFWRARVEAVDEQGHTAETGYLCFRPAFWNVPVADVVEGWALPVFPRRGRMVGVRFSMRSADGRWIPAAEFRVPNPSPGPHPTWKPDPLPATKRDGDLAVTLTELMVGRRDMGPLQSGKETWTHTTFRFSEHGHANPAWEESGFVITDASGNTCLRTQNLFQTRLPDGERFSFRGAAWPEESAWKLKLSFIRTSGFSPAELWTVRDLPVPGLRASRRMNRRVSLQGVTLSLLSVSGRAAPASDWRDPSVQVRMSPMSGERRLTVVRAIDDRGKECTPAYATLMPGGFLTFGLPGATGAKRITVTFAVQKPRVVEFLVKPTVP
jgi:hypothetical protein